VKFFNFLLKNLIWMLPILVEDAGGRSLYSMTSAQLGEAGMTREIGAQPGLTIREMEASGLFCVSKKLECLQHEEVRGAAADVGSRGNSSGQASRGDISVF